MVNLDHPVYHLVRLEPKVEMVVLEAYPMEVEAVVGPRKVLVHFSREVAVVLGLPVAAPVVVVVMVRPPLMSQTNHRVPGRMVQAMELVVVGVVAAYIHSPLLMVVMVLLVSLPSVSFANRLKQLSETWI
jgi:hypothetical protein